MKLPHLLEVKLAEDQVYYSSVLQSLDFFGKWFKSSGLPFFPEYTDHGPDHIEGVLRTAVAIVREEAWSTMTAADSAVLITSTLLHDAAMHLSEDGFLALLRIGASGVPKLQDKPWPHLWEEYLARARRFNAEQLVELFGETQPVRRPGPNPGSWTRNDRLLIGDFIRRHHHRIAHEMAIDGISGLQAGQVDLKLPTDLADLVGLVARSHGIPLRDTLAYLGSEYDVREFRGVHAVFLMVLLRTADYLQVQSDRAPGELLRIKTLRSPISLREWRMHSSIVDIRHTHEDPEAIFVDARPSDVVTFLRIHGLLRGLQRELDISWAVLGEVYGRYEGLRGLGMILRRVRSSIDDQESFAATVEYLPRRAVFEAASGDLLPVLIKPLYGDRPEIGVRELMQNSIDAVRERVELERQLGIVREREESSESDVVLSVEEDGAGFFWLVVADKGIGMTVDAVCSYFLRVGASFRRSDAWRDKFEGADGRSTVIRSGRFGVGVLAAFLLGDEIEVSTRYLESPSSGGLVFRATPSTNLIEIRKANLPIGTTVRVKLSDSASRMFEGMDSWNMERWDWYCLSNPSVERVVESRKLRQQFHLPDAGADLSPEWRRIHHPDYRDIQWSYTQAPGLVCNGIKVRNDFGFMSKFKVEKWLKTPRVSIFDPDGKLPMNLERNSLVGPLPFGKELFDDVARDVIAFIFANAPSVTFWLRSDQWINLARHPALLPDGSRIHPFVFKNEGFSLVSAVEGAGRFVLLGVCERFMPPSAFPSSSDNPFIFVQLYEATQTSISALVSSLIGFPDPVDEDYQSLDIQKLLGSSPRRIVLSEYWAERLSDGPPHVRIQRYRMVAVTEELRVNGWVVWSIGVCPVIPSELVDFIKISETGGDDATGEAFLCAEWYSEEIVSVRSSVARVWREIFNGEIIPYEVSNRSTVLREKLGMEDYVNRYKMLGDQWKRWR